MAKRKPGKELIRTLKKHGFEVLRTQGSIIACGIPMAGQRPYPSTPAWAC